MLVCLFMIFRKKLSKPLILKILVNFEPKILKRLDGALLRLALSEMNMTEDTWYGDKWKGISHQKLRNLIEQKKFGAISFIHGKYGFPKESVGYPTIYDAVELAVEYESIPVLKLLNCYFAPLLMKALKAKKILVCRYFINHKDFKMSEHWINAAHKIPYLLKEFFPVMKGIDLSKYPKILKMYNESIGE